MDACFGLVRKKSAGLNLCPPRHGSTFFADQCDVDNFVQDYSRKTKEAPTVSASQSQSKYSFQKFQYYLCTTLLLQIKNVYLHYVITWETWN